MSDPDLTSKLDKHGNTPSPLRDNLFKNEYNFLIDPMNKTAQKYNILYQTLAPKLIMKKSLANSKI